MNDKKRYSTAASGAMLLPRSVLEHLKDASADELRALIYICAFDGCYDDTDACETCGITESQLNSAVSFWRGTKVLRLGDSQGDIPQRASLSKIRTMQEYDAELLADAKTNDSSFSGVCGFCQSAFEKHTLSRNYLTALYYLYTFVGLPAELICAIIEYCAAKGKRSMQYLVKTAIGLYEENDIDTYEKFEQYTERRRTVDDGVSKLRKLLGIGDRALTTNESQFTEIWFAQREYPFELVRYAYELTVDKLGKYNMKYMNAILDRWHEEGIVTLERAVAGTEAYRASSKSDGNDTFDFDEFAKVAMERKL